MPQLRQQTPNPPVESQPVQIGSDGRFPGTDDWAADKILDETRSRYLIKWEGTDPKTGQPWEHSWEKKSHGGGMLIAQWEEDKRKDPSIVGVEGKKWKEAREEAKIRAKALRAEEIAQLSGKKRVGDKRKRDSTISSSDMPAPPPKRTGQTRGKSTPSETASPATLKKNQAPVVESDLSSLPSETSPSDRPKRTQVPTVKVRENQELQASASKSSVASSSKDVPSSSKVNGSASEAAETSVPKPSSKKVFINDKPTSRPTTPPPSEPSPAISPRSSTRLANASASPISKKSNVTAKPLPLAPIVASPQKASKAKDAGGPEPEKQKDTAASGTGAKSPSTAKPKPKQPESPTTRAAKPSPVAAASPKRPVPKVAAPPPGKKKALAPVPQPDPDVFRPYLNEKESGSSNASGSKGNGVDRSRFNIESIAAAAEKKRSRPSSPPPKHPHGTQSTATSRPSQTDPIAQFSSPVHSPAASAARRLPGPTATSPTGNGFPGLAPPVSITQGKKLPITEQKIIDGVAVTVLVRDESDSSADDTDSDATMSEDGRPGSGASDEVMGPVEPSSMADVEAVEVTVSGSSTILPPETASASQPAQGSNLNGVTLRVVKVEPDAIPAAAQPPKEPSPAPAVAEVPLPEPAAVLEIPIFGQEEEEQGDDDEGVQEENMTIEIEMETDDISVDPVPPPPQPPSPEPQVQSSAPKQRTIQPVQKPNETKRVTVVSRTESIVVQEVVSSPRPHSAIPPSIANFMTGPARAASRTSSVRSRNASPSITSESPTKESSPTLMQSILDEVAVVTEERDQLRNRLGAEMDNNQVFRDQLDRAHRAISELRRQRNEDEKQIALLKEQLQNGLQQQRIFSQTLQQRWNEENQKLRAQNHVLLEQARLTDDGVRMRASKYPALRKEHNFCAQRFAELEQRNEVLRDRNTELSEQMALMRAVKMGVMDGDSPTDGESSDDDSGLSSDYSPARGAGRPKPAQLGTKIDKDVLSPGDKVVRCLFADIGEGCSLVFTDEEAHLQHIQEHKARLGKDPYPVTIPPAAE